MPRSPLQSRTRAGRLVGGAFSAVAVAVVLGGIPVALVGLGGDPLPAHVPGWAAVRDGLLHKDLSGALFIRVLDVVGWLAWACFTLAIVVEVVARLRRRRTVRLPGLAAPQRVAAGLVAAIALTFASPAMADASAHQPRVAAVATAEPGTAPAALVPGGRMSITVPARAPAAALAGPAADRHGTRLVYRVRHGDYLGIIAERFGFDFATATRIAHDNHIADPNLIEPGWRITLPAGATDTGSRLHATGHVVDPPATTPPPGTGPSHPGTQGHTPAPPTPTAPAPTPTAPAPGTTHAGAGQAGGAQQAPAGADSIGDTVIEGVEVGGTLAAVVALALVAAGRRDRRDHRPPQTPPAPAAAAPPPPVFVPPRLMAPTRAADIVRLDTALRHLGDQVQEWEVAEVPQVAGVWLDRGAITLLLADECGPAPRPFVEDPNGWLLPPEVPVARAGDQLAPLPALCTVGGRAGQHVLLDLEYLRVLGIGGDPAEAMNLLRFIAVELCHNVWSDDVRVTLAGFGAEGPHLAAIDPPRFRLRASVAEAIATFGAQHAAAVADLDDVRAPEVLLLAHPSPADQHALRELEEQLVAAPGVGMAVVASPTRRGCRSAATRWPSVPRATCTSGSSATRSCPPRPCRRRWSPRSRR